MLSSTPCSGPGICLRDSLLLTASRKLLALPRTSAPGHPTERAEAHRQDCGAWTRLSWQVLFHNQIAQLLQNFPPDQVKQYNRFQTILITLSFFQVTEAGSPYWSGLKKWPKALDFDPEDPIHFDIVESAANSAGVYGIKGIKNNDQIKAILNQMVVPQFEAKSAVKIAVTDAEAKDDNSMSDTHMLEQLLNELPAAAADLKAAGLRRMTMAIVILTSS